MLAPGGSDSYVPTATPAPAQPPELETVDITVVDDSDIVGKIAGLVRRGEVKGFSSATEMVDKVLARAAGRKIGTLHIYDHGAPGSQQIGKDVTGMYETAGTLDALKRLSGHFGPGGQVVLHGCQAAQGPKGPQLLALLSQAWNVPVSGSEVYQRPGIPGRGLQGTTVECTPAQSNQWYDEMSEDWDLDNTPECTREESNGMVDKVLGRDYLDDLKNLNPTSHLKKLKFW